MAGDLPQAVGQACGMTDFLAAPMAIIFSALSLLIMKIK